MSIQRHHARVICDSLSPDGVRLTTMEVKLPRIVLAEFNTHRVFSRNSASSRAIPIQKMLRMVWNEPYVPSHLGKNQRGMQADTELTGFRRWMALRLWGLARLCALFCAWALVKVNLHKQIANRLLEPFMWHTILCSATEWSNFWHLRNHKDAHPDIRIAAEKMQAAYEASTPKQLKYDEWHLPLIFEEDWELVAGMDRDVALERIKQVSMGRCARVSYLTHDGKRDHGKDIELYERLYVGGHMSPFEHVATPMPGEKFEGNFRGWRQFRKTIPNEHDLLGARAA